MVMGAVVPGTLWANSQPPHRGAGVPADAVVAVLRGEDQALVLVQRDVAAHELTRLKAKTLKPGNHVIASSMVETRRSHAKLYL